MYLEFRKFSIYLKLNFIEPTFKNMPKVNFIMGQNFKCLKADIISLEIEIEYIWEKIWINIEARERCKNRGLSSIFKM